MDLTVTNTVGGAVMLLVTERAGLGSRQAGPWDRVMVRARAFSLDAELARGVPAEASTRLALRAQQLVRERGRREVARGIQRLLARAAQPGASRWPPAPVRWDRVRAAAGEFQALADRLLSPAPLPARGVAQARLLLGDGGGPLYHRAGRDDLRARVAEAVQALDPLAGW
jgi:hypothetical protein